MGNGSWHHLAGVADSDEKKVWLYVDGEQKAEAAWTAATLDDSDKADLVVGADSGEKRFGQGFRGMIHDARLFPRPLKPGEIAALATAE